VTAAAVRAPARILPWIALFLCALLLRGWQFSRTGVGHYDEGVYALSALGIADPAEPSRLFPGEERFSPPVYFTLVGTVARVCGVEIDAAAVGLNVVLGALTVLAVAWIARRWFGPSAGFAAGLLLATSEYHVALSRTALTDVAFALAFLVALFVLVEALERRSILLSVLGGLAVGVAWNTKYHGWLALALVGLALVPALLDSVRRRTADAWKLLALWSVAAAVAGLCYLPWALYVERQPGGYAGLVAYQKTMLRPEWLENALRQGLHQLYFEGPFSRAGVLLAFGAALAFSATRGEEPAPGRTRALIRTALLLALSALVLGGGLTAALLALFALPRLLGRERDLRTTLVAVWIGVWIVLTPMYHPYARLVLPFTIAACLAAGAWLQSRAERLDGSSSDRAWIPGPRDGWLVLAAAALVVAASLFLPDPSNPWRATRDSRRAATALEDKIPLGARVIVLGEPNVAFYLHVAGRPAFESVGGKDLPALLESATETVYVVTGIYAQRTGAVRAAAEQFGERWQLLDTQPFDPTDVRLLDDFAPRRAYAFHARPTREYDLKLYRCEPR
jgi:dolichyl-phosphate-mannose-protein mannosyltransferase